MQNLTPLGICWPNKDSNKPQALDTNEKTKSQLRPVRNSILVKRISSKEQKKRLNATALLKKDFQYDQVGIENHVNFISKKEGELLENEAIGIAAILNTSVMDTYFRTLNGHNQVNASDLRNLPMPNINEIRLIGESVSKRSKQKVDLDSLILQTLKIKLSA